MSIPTGSGEALPQHLRELERANAIRFARARLKDKIAMGLVSVEEVLEQMPECARSMSVYDLLRAQSRWGRVRSIKFLRQQVGGTVSESRRLDKLTERQIGALIAGLAAAKERKR